MFLTVREFSRIFPQYISIYFDSSFIFRKCGNSERIVAIIIFAVEITYFTCNGMIIRAIDGENAVDWYQKQLDINFDDDTGYDITVLFPLVRADYGDIPWALTYSPQNEKKRVFPDEPEPVMFVPSEAKIGEKVRISYSSIQKNIEICEEVCHNISKRPAEVLFGYSCETFSLSKTNELISTPANGSSGEFAIPPIS